MSNITDRLMRGEYISKAECMDPENAERLDRAFQVYGAAMAAYDEHEARMSRCICDWDGDVDSDGTVRGYRSPVVGCPTHAGEDGEDGESE